MANFGERSLARLGTCDPDIQKVMLEAIKHFDFTVLYGNRSKEEQMELFKVGREKREGQWAVVGKTVTNLDGLSKLSKHNYSPSKAIDIAPFPIDWSNIEAFKEMAKVVKAAAQKVGVKLTWGGDWKMRDYPHFEVA